MKEFGFTPAAWHRLTRFDKRVLHYHRTMEQYYMDQATEKQRRDMERKAEADRRQQTVMSDMPKQLIPRRR